MSNLVASKIVRARILVKQGYTPADVAKAFGCSVERIVAAVNLVGTRKHPKRPFKHPANGRLTIWSAEMWQRAVELHDEGMSYDDIAGELGLTTKQVSIKFTNEHYEHKAASERSKIAPRLAERDARLAAADRRSQTAQFFGDPPPGYSALDKKRNEAG